MPDDLTDAETFDFKETQMDPYDLDYNDLASDTGWRSSHAEVRALRADALYLAEWMKDDEVLLVVLSSGREIVGRLVAPPSETTCRFRATPTLFYLETNPGPTMIRWDQVAAVGVRPGPSEPTAGEWAAGLARLVAETDYIEGGHRLTTNVAAFFGWVLNIQTNHAACGPLSLEDTPTAATCPVHGRVEAPEWKPPPS